MPDPSAVLDAANGARVHGLHITAKLLYFYLWPMLREQGETLVKVRACASDLTIKPSVIRRALRRLVAVQLLTCVRPPNRGAAGAYRFGPRAFRHTARREYDPRRNLPRAAAPPTAPVPLNS